MFDETYINKFCQQKRAIEYLVSHKYKYVYLIISKCGCSSMLASLLKDDFDITYDNNIKIWKNVDYNFINNNVKFANTLDKIKLQIHSLYERGYKIFTVVRDEIDKFISWVNECNNNYNKSFVTLNNKFKKYLDILKTKNNIVDNLINNYDKFVSINNYGGVVDLHAIPIHVYLKVFNRLDVNIETININELSIFYKNLTGNELTKNNITETKILTRDALTNEQLNIIKTKTGIA